ncbi:hypothetical protein HHK36_029096 [Tetracentron sinense]|uniref:BZIP domain-containing protein n=1 Tax=Tetracentron sinense TaxID=13715 RepID=A0A834YH04_TETSI|nr:hypothetical protein HHK36_029096 [Tetracentron sinense]
MGNNEAGKPSKSDKASSPAQKQTNVHLYPDWAAIQHYYGPGVTLPPPYFNSAVTSSHAPHPYMWVPPQPMIPPYGTPYAAIYSHGGVYAHPAVPLGLNPLGHGIPSSSAVSEALVATPLSMETPTKSSGNTDRGLMKKLKGFDGLAVSIGNGNAESTVGGAGHGMSQRLTSELYERGYSGECGTEGSSDGSDRNTSADQTWRKSCEANPSIGNDSKIISHVCPIPGGEVNTASSRALGVTVASASIAGQSIGTIPKPSISTALELSGSPSVKAKTDATSVPPSPVAVVPSDVWVQDERELKRERRKQSNRESARRSRLRKQSESEELALKVESLNVENMALKSEINRLTEDSEKLRLANAALLVLTLSLSLSIYIFLFSPLIDCHYNKYLGKLKNAQLGLVEETVTNNIDDQGAPPIGTENFLSGVNNSGFVNRIPKQEGGAYENTSNSSTKLHQLLESNPRADAVAAG